MGGGYGYSLPHQNKRRRFLRSLPWVFELESFSHFPIWPTLVFSIARVGKEKKDRARLEFTYPFSSLILPLRSKSKMALRSLSTHTLACLKANPTVQAVSAAYEQTFTQVSLALPQCISKGKAGSFLPQGSPPLAWLHFRFHIAHQEMSQAKPINSAVLSLLFIVT